MWLIESNAKSYEEIGYRSLDWGNFYGASFTYYATVEATSTSTKDHGMGIVLPTGARAGSDADNWKRNCANNIYDLAGNTMEFTQEASDMSTRSTLGSVCLFRDVFYPMAERYSQSPEETDNAVSCRMHLIIS